MVTKGEDFLSGKIVAHTRGSRRTKNRAIGSSSSFAAHSTLIPEYCQNPLPVFFEKTLEQCSESARSLSIVPKSRRVVPLLFEHGGFWKSQRILVNREVLELFPSTTPDPGSFSESSGK